MAEGRPPFRDRGRPDATLKAVDRLPLRSPVRAGPLAQVIQGMLRKNARERLTAPVARDALLRVIRDEPDTSDEAVPSARLRDTAGTVAAPRVGRTWNTRASRKLVLAGTALAVVTVAVLATTDNLPGIDASASGADTTPSAAAPAPPAPSVPSTGGNTAVPEETITPSASPSAPAPPPPRRRRPRPPNPRPPPRPRAAPPGRCPRGSRCTTPRRGSPSPSPRGGSG